MVRKTAIILVSIIVIISAVALVQGFADTGPCVTFSNSQQTACGYTVSSNIGQGAVELCQNCFMCGDADDICPEDFGANCSGCADPDCLVTITINVHKADGTPLGNAEIVIDLDHIPLIVEHTDDAGRITMDVPQGDYPIRVEYPGYPYQQFPAPTTSGTHTQNVIMTAGECSSECTIWKQLINQELCDVSCRGDNGCAPQEPIYVNDTNAIADKIMVDLLEKCSNQGVSADAWVTLGVLEDGKTLRGKCCSGPVIAENRPKAIRPETNASNTIVERKPGTLKGTQGSESVTQVIIITD